MQNNLCNLLKMETLKCSIFQQYTLKNPQHIYSLKKVSTGHKDNYKCCQCNISEVTERKIMLQQWDESEHASDSLPINGEQLKRGGLVTDRASPCGLLLIHLQEKDCIETLKMCTSQNSTWYT